MSTPPSFPPLPNQAPSNPSASGRIRQTMQRRVALPMWALVVGGLALCVCGVLAGGTSKGSSADTAGTNSQGAGASSQASYATQAPTKVSATATPTHVPTWTTVQTFTGNGISKTAPFTVNDSQWKIVWSCDPAAYGSEYNLMADLTKPGDQFGDSVVNVICKVGDASSTQGETMEYTQGTFYLDVNSEASWKFIVQVLK
jgi:hypothetical protein